MIWMDVDTALSEVPVNTCPLTDDTDFKTVETAVAYNAAGLTLYWHFVTTAGAHTSTQVTPTTGGAYDWAHQAQGMYTIEIPASGGASINNDTEGFGWFTGVATGVLPWRGPTIGFRAAGINNLLVDDAHSATRGLAGTALPNAAADAAGGLPISDAGGLDLDAQIGTKISDILTDTGTTLQGELDGIQADTEDIQSRLPAALVSGRMDASVGAMAANTLTATAIQSDAITAAKIADGAIDAATFAADVDAEILSYLVDDATRIDASALNTASGTSTPAIKAKTDQLSFNGSGHVAAAAGASSFVHTSGKLWVLDGDGNPVAPASDSAPAKSVADKLDTALALDGSVYQFTANALELAPTGGSAPTASAIADEVQTRTIARVTLVDTCTTNTDMRGTDGANTTAPDNASIAAILVDTGTTIPAQITALNNLSAAQVNTEVDTALADVGLTTTVTGRVDAAVSTRLASASYSAPPSAATNASAVRTELATELGRIDAAVTTRPTLDQILAGGDVDGYTLEETLKLCLAALAGKLSGAATTTVTIRAADDSTNRLVATVDEDGNRTAVTLNAAG